MAKTKIKPGSSIDLAAAVHFAAVRVFQRGTMTAAVALSALPPLEFLDTDPIDIFSANRDGIVSQKLSVEGLPDSWLSKWITRPVVDDWASGLVFVNVAGTNQRFYPTLDRLEIDALFAIERKDVEQSSSAAKSEGVTEVDPVTQASPVALTALKSFIRSLMVRSV